MESQKFAQNQIIIKKAAGVSKGEIQTLQAEIGAATVETTKTLGIELWKVEDKNPEAMIRLLNQSEEIEYAGYNWEVKVNAIPNDPSFSSLWGMHNTGQTGGTNDADIDAQEAWDITTGNGQVLVGIIDTGIDYNHPDLAANIWKNPGEIAGNNKDDDGNGYVDDIHGYDFVNNDGNPFDDEGHGTHVAGTIGAVGNNGVGVAGVNWNVKMAGIKFLGADGSGYTFDAIKSIEYAIAIGADLTNNSWGGGGFDQGLYDAIKKAGEAGQVFVAAAGNDASNNDLYPSYPSSYDLDNIISVAATNHNDQLASWFSNYGVKSVDLAAPGENILSTIPGNKYASYNGTSMATPHVAGAAALILSQNPNLTPDQLKNRILATVDQLPNLNGVVATGGRLNLRSALVGPQPGAMEGSTWNDLDKDGVWDTNESALAGWTIFLDQDGDKILDPSEVSTVTDANGKYVFNNLESGNYVVVEVQQPGWVQTFPAVGAGVIFNADFSNTSGTPNLDGFVIDNTGGTVNGLWHLSTRRGNEAGHSADDSMYFGDENTGNYDVGHTAGRITSPVIDLTKSNTTQLSFKYFLKTEGDAEFDAAQVLISKNGGAFTPIASNAVELTDPTTAWTSATFDLSPYVSSNIKVQFDFNTNDDFFNTYEGWYIDDVVVKDTSDGTHKVFVGNGQTVTGVNFGNYSEAEQSIIDIDNPVKIVEGLNANGQLTFTVELSEISTLPVTVEYKTVDGTAKAGSDYTAASGILTFDSGDTSKTISVAILNDNQIENDETFKVVLSNPIGGNLGDNEGEGKITDTIKSAATKTLPTGVERLTLTGTGNINGVGNTTPNRITGNNGINTLDGKAGNDQLIGNAGKDLLIGGAGTDVVTGNGGNDNFRFNALSEKGDKITDFLPGTDKINIKQTGFSTNLAIGVLPASQFVLGTAPKDTNDYFIYNQSKGQLFFDADGSGAAQTTQLLATLTGSPALTAAGITIF